MEKQEEEEKVFVYSIPYSNLMDSSTADQDEKISDGEASTSGASSGSTGTDTQGSPTPLMPEHVVEVNHNSITMTIVKHSPLFRTKLPQLSAHQMALSAGSTGSRRHHQQRFQSPYAPKGNFNQPGSYNKWSKQRKKDSCWSRRRRYECPLLWCASAILIILLIAGIMIVVFRVSGSRSNNGWTDVVNAANSTNTTTGDISALSSPSWSQSMFVTGALSKLSPLTTNSMTGDEGNGSSISIPAATSKSSLSTSVTPSPSSTPTPSSTTTTTTTKIISTKTSTSARRSTIPSSDITLEANISRQVKGASSTVSSQSSASSTAKGNNTNEETVTTAGGDTSLTVEPKASVLPELSSLEYTQSTITTPGGAMTSDKPP